MIYRRRACVARLAGRSQQNCSCSEADDTCRDSRAEIIIVFVSVMISIIVSLVMVVAATVVTPTVARAGFSSREGRQKKGAREGGGNKTFAHGLHWFSPKAGAVLDWRRI